MTTVSIARAYLYAIYGGLILQLVMSVILASVLDGGFMSRIGGCALLGTWIGTVIVLLRRPRDPTRIDLLYISVGYVVMFVFGVVIAHWMGLEHP
jgi:hypothetical protein